MNIQMAIEFLKNLNLGWAIAGGILGIAIARQIIKSKKFEDKLGAVSDKAGQVVSAYLISKIGKTMGSAVELIIIDVKRIVDTMLGRFIIGLRKDDKNGELKKAQAAFKVVKELNDTTRENIKPSKAVATVKKNKTVRTQKVKSKIKGKSNL